MLLQSVMRLQDATARGVGGFVQEVSRQARKSVQEITKQAAHGLKQASEGFEEMSRQASNGVQGITTKMLDVVHSVGERASYRHSRAKKNARKVRETSELYAQKIQEGLGRAGEIFNIDRLSKTSMRERRLLRREGRERKRQIRHDVWRERAEAGKARGRRMLSEVMAWH
ncbi:hypothetical protein M422DRAFT_44290 [Sphaerobolus stellatus SS14]|nr:hypothetical protein M422DRAFT_44290 [Sphaerobolus stellatus SS14]